MAPRQHVLFLSFPMYGHVFPSLTIAEELGRRGHRVTFATGSAFADHVRRAGVDLYRYDDELAEIPSRVGTNPSTNEVTISCLTFVEQSLRSLTPERSGLDRPDVVVCDPLCFFVAAVLCGRWDVPLVTAHANVACNEAFNWPAGHREQLLADPVLGARAVEVETTIATLMAAHGESEDRMTRGEDLTLVFAPRALQPLAETFGDSYVFVGPCTEGSVFEGQWERPDDRPVLFISLGTLYNDRPEYFRRFVRVFGELDWRVVISTGGADLTGLDVPPNIELHPWVPQLSVLRQASVFLTNGGLGGITSALQQGTPVVLMPEASEQWMHATRVAELGLGRIVSYDDSPETLRTTILEVAADEATLARVRTLRTQIRQAGGTLAAADAVESLLTEAELAA